MHPEVKMNYLASPPLVVAYAHRRHGRHRPHDRAARHGQRRQRRVPARHLADQPAKIADTIAAHASARRCSSRTTPTCSRAIRAGTRSPSPDGEIYAWDAASTYIKNPPYFDGMTHGRRHDRGHPRRALLGMFGDSITTDHISPAGNIKADSPAGRFLHLARRQQGRLQFLWRAARQRRRDGARHLRQHPPEEPDGAGGEGGVTVHQPSSKQNCRIERTCDPISIDLSRRNPRQEYMPIVICAIPILVEFG